MAIPFLCLRPSCGRVQVTRGLCQTCYKAAKRLVEECKTTWEQIEVDGKCKPKKSWRRTPSQARLWFLEKS